MQGGVWIASYVLLWIAVLVLGLTTVALLRQVGVLHTRLRPMGAHFAGEGPQRLAPAPAVDVFDYGRSGLTLLAFVSPECQVCAVLLPSLRALDRQYDDLTVHVVDHAPETTGLFRAFNVSSTPYIVTVDHDGIVRVRGVANSLEQVEVMIEESLEPDAA